MTRSPKGANRHPTNILPGDTEESLSLGTSNALDWTQHCSKSTGKNTRLEYLNFQDQFCFGLAWCQALGYCSSGRQWCQRSRLLPWARRSARLTRNFFQVSPLIEMLDFFRVDHRMIMRAQKGCQHIVVHPAKNSLGSLRIFGNLSARPGGNTHFSEMGA